MKHLLIILCLFWGGVLNAQQRFSKVIGDSAYGKSLRIVATPGNSWAVFSMDSLKLTKFSSCGTVEWSRRYTIPDCQYHFDFIATANGFALLSWHATDAVTYGALITSINAQGNITASKSVTLSPYGLVPYSLFSDPQGNYIIYANASPGTAGSYSMLCKVDLAGTVLWTRFYDLGIIWGKAINTSDQGYLLRSGPRFIKTDAAGNIQWATRVNANSSSYYNAVEVSDGYIFTTIDTWMQTMIFHKINKQGHLLWGKYANYYGDLPYLRELPGDRFASVFNTDIGVMNYPVVIEFDKDLNVLRQNAYASNQPGIGLIGKDLCFLNDGSCAITGIASTTPYPFCIKTDKAYRSGCDVIAPAFTTTPQTDSYTLINVNQTSENFNLSDLQSSSQIETPALITWCETAKTLKLTADTTLCQDETINLKNLTGDLFDTYRWSTGDTSASITVGDAGIYRLSAKDHCVPGVLTDSFRLIIKAATTAKLGQDLTKCEDSLLVLTAPACNDCSYTWSNGSNHNSISVTGPGSYWLRIDNTNGCHSSDTIRISQTRCHCSLFVPNAFTPDGDELNDVFRPMYHCEIEEYQLRIYNRWGELLYESHDPTEGWNGYYKGHPAKQDIYSYQISYRPLIRDYLQQTIRQVGKVLLLHNNRP